VPVLSEGDAACASCLCSALPRQCDGGWSLLGWLAAPEPGTATIQSTAAGTAGQLKPENPSFWHCRYLEMCPLLSTPFEEEREVPQISVRSSHRFCYSLQRENNQEQKLLVWVD